MECCCLNEQHCAVHIGLLHNGFEPKWVCYVVCRVPWIFCSALPPPFDPAPIYGPITKNIKKVQYFLHQQGIARLTSNTCFGMNLMRIPHYISLYISVNFHVAKTLWVWYTVPKFTSNSWCMSHVTSWYNEKALSGNSFTLFTAIFMEYDDKTLDFSGYKYYKPGMIWEHWYNYIYVWLCVYICNLCVWEWSNSPTCSCFIRVLWFWMIHPHFFLRFFFRMFGIFFPIQWRPAYRSRPGGRKRETRVRFICKISDMKRFFRARWSRYMTGNHW